MCARCATSGGSPIRRPVTNANTGGMMPTRTTAVTPASSRNVNRRSARKDCRSRTSALDAVSSIMIGDSASHASANATPYAARLNAASGIRAMIAATYGPSMAIISHVAANGSQNARMNRVRSGAPDEFGTTSRFYSGLILMLRNQIRLPWSCSPIRPVLALP